MKVEIVVVGDEILSGEIHEANAYSLAGRLNGLGIGTGKITVVGDTEKEISDAVKSAMRNADIVFTIGGLGTTPDDMTKAVVAKVLGLKMKFNSALMEEIKEKYRKIGRRKLSKSMATYGDVPAGAVVLPNPVGIAPGILVKKGKKTVILLPGPPREVNAIIDEGVVPYLTETVLKTSYMKRIIRTTGTGENTLYEMLNPLISRWKNVTVSFLPGSYEVRIVLRMKNSSGANAGKILDEKQKQAAQRIKKYVYALEDVELVDVVARELINRKLTVSTAESCTAGAISSRLTDVSGSSAYFMQGAVCYSNESKIRDLGVPPGIIEKYGAVSPQTAKAMAEGIRKKSKTDIGLSTTGIFGPTGGTPKKPVGLVYIGYADKRGTKVYKYNFGKRRDRSKIRTTNEALNILRKLLSFGKRK